MPIKTMPRRAVRLRGFGVRKYGMTRECLTSVWSLHRRAEIIVRIRYRILSGRLGVLQLTRVTELTP